VEEACRQRQRAVSRRPRAAFSASAPKRRAAAFSPFFPPDAAEAPLKAFCFSERGAAVGRPSFRRAMPKTAGAREYHHRLMN